MALRELFIKIKLDSGNTHSELEKISSEVDRAKVEFEKFGGKSSGAMRELSKSSGVYVDSTGKLRDASGRFTKLKSDIDSTKTSTDNLKMAFSGLAAIGIGAAIVGVGSSILNVGINFQAQMSQVAAATDASEEDLALLTSEARKLGATTTFSATEAAEAMTELGKAGLNTKQIMVGTNAVLQLAGAGQLGLAEATTIASDTMSGFGLQAEDMGRIADVMAKGANASTISVQMMGETFKYVSGVAKTANVSLEETAAMTAILGNAGIKGSMAGTTLKTMLLQLASPSKEAAKIMSGLGIQTADAAGNMLPIADIIGDLQKSMSGFGNKKKIDIMSTIFGSEPAAGVLALLDKGKTGIQEMTEVMKNSGGSAADFAKKANANIKGMLKSLNSIIEEIQLKIFDKLIPLIEPVLSFFTDSEKGMARTSFVVALLSTALGVGLVLAAKSAMVAGYAMLAPYLPLIGFVAILAAKLLVVYLILEDIWTFFEYGPSASNTYFADLMRWLGVTEGELQGMHKAFKEFKKVLGEMAEGFSKLMQNKWIKYTLLGIVGIIAAIVLFKILLVVAVVGAILYVVAKWDWLVNSFKTGLLNLWNYINSIAIFKFLITSIKVLIVLAVMLGYGLYLAFQKLVSVISPYQSKLVSLFNFIKKSAILLGKAMLLLFPITYIYIFREEIASAFAYLWSLVTEFPFVKKLVSQFLTLKDKLSAVFSGMWESLKSIFVGLLPTETLNNLIDGINWISQKLNEFSSGTIATSLGITPLNLPAIPRMEARAEGGPVEAGHIYRVNERGEETFQPASNGYIQPHSKSQASSGGNTYQFSVSINSASPDYDAYALYDKVMELINGENEKMKQRSELGVALG